MIHIGVLSCRRPGSASYSEYIIFLCGSILNTTVHKNRSRSILDHEQFLIVLKADLDGTTFAYDCRMRFLERVLLASCKKSHTTLVIQHCLFLRFS